MKKGEVLKLKNITLSILILPLFLAMPDSSALISENVQIDSFLLPQNYKIIDEKVAVFPEYDFENIYTSGFALKETAIKEQPSDTSKTIRVLNAYEEIKITGINNLDFWRVNLSGNDFYVNKNDITLSKASLDLKIKKDSEADDILSQTEQLKSNVRKIDDEEIINWALKTQILPNKDDLDEPIASKDFILYLWKLNKSPKESILKTDDEYALSQSWLRDNVEKISLKDNITIKESLEIFSELNGFDDYEEFNKTFGLIVPDDEINIDESLSKIECMRMLYYSHHNRRYNAFPISVDEFLESCKNTMDFARINGYKYGNSTAQNPTTDGYISCDRLVAKALYDLGYTDQPTGGITCGDADDWLSSHGFIRSTSWEDVKQGSIMLVKHQGKDHTSHMFVFASDFNMNTMTGDRYDAGSDGFIQSSQPLKNLGFWYRTDSIIVFNIPE